jgi:EAL domain-containing protein (putative c-di-GMP-specific phosphodiesterase class I)
MSDHAEHVDFMQANPLGESHEGRLLHDLRAISGAPQDRAVLRLHISRLAAENRDVESLRAAETAFDDVARMRSARLYRLRNCDLIVMYELQAVDSVERDVMKLLRLWGNDPLLVKFKADPRKNKLCSWIDLSTDYNKLLAFAERQVGDEMSTGKTLAELVAEREVARANVERGQPLTPLVLGRAEDALARVDLSSFTRRQPVCAFVDDGKPESVFTELFVSIGDLRETVLPGIDMTANPWLFQRLTQTLDRRVMAQMARKDDRSLLRDGFSVNLNIATLMSDEFLAFDDNFAPSSGDVVLEVRLEDIFADLGAFAFARDFVHERGYRICVDGVTMKTFPYADTNRLGVAYAKLAWAPEIAAMASTDRGKELKAMVRERRRGRTILSRCDTDVAVRIGQQLGITLFQGRYIDGLLREKY